MPRLKEDPEDPLWGGGFPHHPGGCGPWGEHGIGRPEDPWPIWLWAGGCRGGHYVIVLAFQNCTPDLWQGPVAVCRWRRRVLVGDVEAGGTEGGVAVGCGGLFPLFRLVRVCRVALLRWSSWKARDSFVADVGVGVVCQGLASLDGGDPDALVLLVPASPPT